MGKRSKKFRSSISSSDSDKKKSLSRLKAKIITLKKQVEHKDRTISQMSVAHQQSLEEKDRLISQMSVAHQQSLEEKDRLISQMSVAHQQLLAEKERMITFLTDSYKQVISNKDKLVDIQDKLFLELKDKITTLSTELAFKEGFLNSTGIIEQFEFRYATEAERRTNRTRFELWRAILQKNDCKDMRRFFFQHANYNDIETASRAIVHAYDLLSRHVHQEVTRKELIIADDLLRREQAIILSFIAFKLNIKFESKHVNRQTIEDYLKTERTSHLRSQ